MQPLPQVLEARFLVTAVQGSPLPTPELPEVAFVGRSNVGKSSMINALTGRRKLVRVSNTPGRTRALNFFDVDLRVGEQRHHLCLCDLPGYGFAKVSKSERAAWKKLIGDYLRTRASLGLVVAIIDAEIGPTPDDLLMLDWLVEADRKILVAATKIDRLVKAKRKPRIAELTRQLELPPGAVIPFSATEKIGVGETWELLAANLLSR